MNKPQLNKADYVHAAAEIGCDVAMVEAFAAVESRSRGFLDNGMPVILFERHKFSSFTNGAYDLSHPDISNPASGGYIGGVKEHGRLDEAAHLDREAALKSASWGKFQIMGFNYKVCGFDSLQAFINAMYRSERAQLDAFVAFIKHEGLDRWMIAKDFARLAKGYNGSGYRRNKYDEKLRKAYIEHGGVL